jgi:hypothetical protein
MIKKGMKRPICSDLIVAMIDEWGPAFVSRMNDILHYDIRKIVFPPWPDLEPDPRVINIAEVVGVIG